MTLKDTVWSGLEGGYRTIYDASIPLERLEKTSDPNESDEIWAELWNELHHQGDVGLASYLALPQIIRIGKLKNIFDLNLLGLCLVIEQQRVLGNNPSLPIEFELYYKQGLEDMYLYTMDSIKKDLDKSTFTYAIAALATCKGLTKLGKAIMEMEDTDFLEEFLQQF